MHNCVLWIHVPSNFLTEIVHRHLVFGIPESQMPCLTRFIQRQLLMISHLIPHSLNIQGKLNDIRSLNGIRSLRNKMFRSFVFGVMALTSFKQILLYFNTINQFKVVKCLQMTKKKKKKKERKKKHLRNVKQNWKRLFSAFFFATFSKGGIIRQNANGRVWNLADHSNSKV